MGFGLVGSLLGAGISGLLNKNKKKESSTAAIDSTTTGSQADLPPELLSNLQSLFQQLTGSQAGSQVQQAGQQQLSNVAAFDPTKFAQDITAQAASDAGLQLDSATNDVLNRAGGGRGSSSAALLINKLKNTTAANLAGISANARISGEQFKSDALNKVSNDLANQISNIIQITRGSSVSGTLREIGSQSGRGSARAGGGIGGFFQGVSSVLPGLFGVE